MKRHLRSTGAILISILGLISCRQETSAPDAWDAQAPSVESPSHHGHRIQLHADFNGSLPADSVFSFPSIGPGAIQEISAHSSCRQQSDPVESTRFFHPGEASSSAGNGSSTAPVTIPLATLLPSQILLTIAEPTPASIQCQFDFLITDQAGSTREFHTKSVPILDLTDIENFPLASRAMTSSELSQLNLAFDLPDGSKGPTLQGSYLLACDSFQNSRSSQTDELLSDLLHELTEGDVQVDDVQASTDALKVITDSRQSRSRQACRLVVVKDDGVSPQVTVTSAFQLQFELHDMAPTATTAARVPSNAMMAGTPIYSITLTNPNSVPVAYRFRNANPSFRMTPVGYSTAVSLEIGESAGSPVDGTLALSTSARNWSVGVDQIVEIPARGSVVVTYVIQTKIDCTQPGRQLPHTDGFDLCRDPGGCVFIGAIWIDLAQPLQASRILNWSGAPDAESDQTASPRLLTTGLRSWSLTDRGAAAGITEKLPVHNLLPNGTIIPTTPFPYCF